MGALQIGPRLENSVRRWLDHEALWIPSGGERSLEDMKCCKLPTDGYVNAFKCKAEKIENEDREAICSSGVVVGIHA